MITTTCALRTPPLWSILLTLIEMFFGKSDLAAEPFGMGILARFNRRIGCYDFGSLFS